MNNALTERKMERYYKTVRNWALASFDDNQESQLGFNEAGTQVATASLYTCLNLFQISYRTKTHEDTALEHCTHYYTQPCSNYEYLEIAQLKASLDPSLETFSRPTHRSSFGLAPY